MFRSWGCKNIISPTYTIYIYSYLLVKGTLHTVYNLLQAKTHVHSCHDKLLLYRIQTNVLKDCQYPRTDFFSKYSTNKNTFSFINRLISEQFTFKWLDRLTKYAFKRKHTGLVKKEKYQRDARLENLYLKGEIFMSLNDHVSQM